MQDIQICTIMTVEPASVAPNDTVEKVVKLMHENRYSCVVVVDDDGKAAGIVSERDTVRALCNQVGLDQPASAIMTSPVVAIGMSQSLHDALVLTRNRKIRRLPVVDRADKVVGIVTQTDLVQAQHRLIARHRDSLEELVDDRTAELEAARERETWAQKSAFASRLATGLMHEFNNPIACIRSNLSYLEERNKAIGTNGSAIDWVTEWTNLAEELPQLLAESLGALDRMQRTIQEVQTLTESTNRRDNENAATDLGPVLQDALLAVERATGKAIHSDAIVDAGCIAAADESDLANVFLLLMRFLVRRHDDGDTCNLRVEARSEDENVVATISSSDVAVSESERDAILDPGLVVEEDRRVRLSVDLSVCSTSIAQSQGSLRVLGTDDQPGLGFEIRLPQARQLIS